MRHGVVAATILLSAMAVTVSGAGPDGPHQVAQVPFAWPPHTAGGEIGGTVALVENASGTGIDFVTVRDTTIVTVNPEDAVVRVTAEWPPWTNGSFATPYVEQLEPGRVCAPVDSLDPDPEEECHEGLYLRGLDVSWRDRPAALIVEHHRVRWVLEYGALRASSDASDTAATLGRMMGLGAMEWDAEPGHLVDRIVLHEPEGSTAGETSSTGQSHESRKDALETVRLVCEECSAFRASPRNATLWSESIEWVVDPDGFVAWVESYPRVDWAAVDLIPVSARDTLVRQYADAHGLEPRHGKLYLNIDFDDRTLFWPVMFHYEDDPDPNDHMIWMHEARLNALDGSWRVVHDSGQPPAVMDMPSWTAVALVAMIGFGIVLWRPRD